MTSTLTTTIQIKLLPDQETWEKLQELISRDTWVMNRVLGILNQEEQQLYQKSNRGKWNTNRSKLAACMLRTKTNTPTYDLKSEFINISHNELSECIDVASETYTSFLNLREKQRIRREKSRQKGRKKPSKITISKPRMNTGNPVITRRMGSRRFSIDTDTNSLSTLYSCVTNLEVARGLKNRVRHDWISIKYVPNARALEYFTLGKPKALTIQRKGKTYFANVTVDVEVPEYQPTSKTLAMIGIDLGIAKTATAVLYTDQGIVESIVLNDGNIKDAYIKSEKNIANLQRQAQYRSSIRYRRFFQYMAQQVKHPQLSQYLLHLNRQIKNGTISTKMVEQTKQLTVVPFVDKEIRERLLEKLDQLIDAIDHNILGKTANLIISLKRRKTRRADLKREMINQICNELSYFVQKYATTYDLYITVGRPNGIQYRHQRGSGNKALRKRINRWAFRMFQVQLRHNMAKLGIADRLIEVGEAWTSIRCWKCNRKGVRPRQDAFYCSNYRCLNRENADVNGAANIAKRGIVRMKLVDQSEYDRYHIQFTNGKNTKSQQKVKATVSIN